MTSGGAVVEDEGGAAVMEEGPGVAEFDRGVDAPDLGDDVDDPLAARVARGDPDGMVALWSFQAIEIFLSAAGCPV